jgi:TonB family protein
MKKNQERPAATGRRPKGDIVHFIEPKPETKHVVAGLIFSLMLHGSLIAKPAYEAWQQAKQWGALLGIQVVDEPGRAAGHIAPDIIALTKPLYYPPGLVKPRVDLSREEEERQRRLQEARRRQEEAARRAREQEAAAEQTAPSAEEGSTQQSDVERNLEILRQGATQARTLNIGPIRDQIIQVYRAQQEGKIRIGDISVAVNFRVREDGAFTNVRLMESSGIPEVDSAALIIVDELSNLQSLAPLQKTDSVSLRLTIGQDVEFRVTVAAPSEAVAVEQVSQLNGLLLAARYWATTKQQAQAASLLASLQIVQEGVNIVASVRIPRAEATRLFKERVGAGS